MTIHTFLKLKSIPILTFCIYICGCATSSVNMVKPIDRNTMIDPTQGVVTARVINATSISIPFNYLTITPKNLNESESIKATRLQSLPRTVGTSSLFASQVAPGEYSLDNIRIYYSGGEYWYSKWVSSDIKLGTFEVKPGQVTDLGTLIYYRKTHEDRYVDILLRSPSHDPSPVNYALNSYNVDLEDPLAWLEDDYEQERQTLYTSAVQNPTNFNQRTLAADGSLYFAGNLGTILERTNEKEWRMDAVDTDADLTSIIKTPNGHIVVGGEQGALFVKDPNTGAWRQIEISPNVKVDAILHIKNDTIDVITHSYKSVKVYRIDLNNEGDRTLMAEYKHFDGWFDKNGTKLNVGTKKLPTNGRTARYIEYVSVRKHLDQYHLFLGVNIGISYDIFSNTSHSKFMFDPQTWKIEKSKGFEKGITSIIGAGAIDLGIKPPGFWSLSGKNEYFRYANGQWEKITTYVDNCPSLRNATRCMKNNKEIRRKSHFNFGSIPVFKNENEAIAYVHFKTNSTEKVSKFIETSDGGKTWTKTNKELPSKYCASTVPESKGSLLLTCPGVSGDFYESLDHGETWEHVREHENF